MPSIASKIVALGIICSSLLYLGGSLETSAALTNAAYDRGVSLYNQKNYRAAAQEFEKAIKESPDNPNAVYYCALCAQLSNNRARARQLFEYLLQRFPQSRVAPMAQSALNQLSSLSQTSSSASSASSSSSSSSTSSYGAPAGGASDPDLASVPDLVRVPFEKQRNDIVVNVQVNGRSVPFIFDTGAASVVVGRNHLTEWGLSSAEAKQTMTMGGVGEGKAKGWIQRLDIKLGQIYRKNFPVTVMDNMPTEPLLGQTFLHSFNTSIDDASGMILLAKKGGSASKDVVHRSYNGIEIPFRRGSGGHMMVNAFVNGKPLVMMFDTGAQQTCIRMADWTAMGFEIPSSAHEGTSKGILGETKAYYFNVDSIVLKGASRAVEQDNTPVHVTEGSPASLLGMSFFGNYTYKIDSARNVIIFEGAN